MLSTLALVTLVVVVSAIPPPEFGFVDSGNHTELSVAYSFNGNTTVVQEGQLFGGNITSQKPALALDPAQYKSVADYQGQYLVLMVDPDAPTPDNPTGRFILHWLATNMMLCDSAPSPQTGKTLTNSTVAQVPYRAPGPPLNSSAHRYILYAFAQPSNFTMPTAFTGFSNANRSNFNLDKFMKDAGLGRPAAGEFYYVSRQQNVPGDFVALAGGQYPGGNGNAVFVGSASSGTATGTPTSNTGSGSSSGSGSGNSSAGVAVAGRGFGGGILGSFLLSLAAAL